MIQRAWDYIKLNKMIEKGDRIVVGVSGGADSVCLLYVLISVCKEVGAEIRVVHVNHGIRGEEAFEDEAFVKELCKRWKLEIDSYFYSVKEIAKKEGLSEEEAGRKVRYQAFLESCRKNECNKIAIAHNKNDNAETILFHLFRGTGIKGLTGIDPTREMVEEDSEATIIRPILFAERREIEEFLKREKIDYKTDSTNLTEDYTRNKIRNRILPYATSEINVGTVDHIIDAASQLKEAYLYIENMVSDRFHTLVVQKDNVYQINIQSLEKEDIVIQKGIIKRVLELCAGSHKDLELKHVESILSLKVKQVGRYVNLPYQLIGEKGYDSIRIFRLKPSKGEKKELTPFPAITLEIPGEILIAEIGKRLETQLISYKKDEPIPKSSCIKWFDYDKIENAVEIRTRREGDFLQVNAAGGRKKLKDYFIDHKIPQKQRDSQLLITDGSHIMWIPGLGERISEKYKVDETTKNVLLMKMIDLEDIVCYETLKS